jgi:hypothetical protein
MPRYSWEGRTANGSLVRGELEAPSPPPARPHRPGSRLRENLFLIGVCGGFAFLGVGAAWIDPVLFYDCARQANGSVDCTVHRRVYGFIPRADLHFPRIVSVEVKSGVHSESTPERDRRIRLGGSQSSWEAILLVCADGTRWQSPESSWPAGQTAWDHWRGIRQLLDASSPGTYRGWTAEKVTLTIAVVFFIPTGFVLLGLVLRLVIPRSLVEGWLAARRAAAAGHRRSP